MKLKFFFGVELAAVVADWTLEQEFLGLIPAVSKLISYVPANLQKVFTSVDENLERK